MRVCVLGSSSSGNATFISDGATRVLIDTGSLPVLAYIRPTLQAIGEDWNNLDAIVISHDHGDHLNGNTFSVAFRTATPVYVPAPVGRRLARRAGAWPYVARCLAAGLVRTYDGSIRIGSLEVDACELPHDCDPTLGFRLTGRDGSRVGVATDLGHCPDAAARHLRNCDVLVFEANHDVTMELESGRDPSLIERNLGPKGHLDNQACAEALCRIIGGGRRRPQCVLLAHLSRECNHPALARRTVLDALGRHGLDQVAVETTWPRRPSTVIDSGRRR